MKKTGILIFAFFYFVLSSGLTLHMHYCAGKLKGFSIAQSNEKGCCGTKKKSKGCCKEKLLVYKIKNDQKSDVKATVPIASVKQFLAHYSVLDFSIDKPSIDLYKVPDCNAPPFRHPDPVYLLNRNFRI